MGANTGGEQESAALVGAKRSAWRPLLVTILPSDGRRPRLALATLLRQPRQQTFQVEETRAFISVSSCTEFVD